MMGSVSRKFWCNTEKYKRWKSLVTQKNIVEKAYDQKLSGLFSKLFLLNKYERIVLNRKLRNQAWFLFRKELIKHRNDLFGCLKLFDSRFFKKVREVCKEKI